MTPIWAKDKKDKILEEIAKILKEYGLESNIPFNSSYWSLKRALRELDRS